LAADLDLAESKCLACADAYKQLGRSVDAAEALLERVLVAVRREGADAAALAEEIAAAETLLTASGAHQPLACIARGRVALLARSLPDARAAFDAAIAAAEQSGQRDWLWRALSARAELFGR